MFPSYSKSPACSRWTDHLAYFLNNNISFPRWPFVDEQWWNLKPYLTSFFQMHYYRNTTFALEKVRKKQAKHTCIYKHTHFSLFLSRDYHYYPSWVFFYAYMCAYIPILFFFTKMIYYCFTICFFQWTISNLVFQ